MIVGVFFLLDGLDDKNDYLRFSHGMWHVFISIFSWFAFNSVQIDENDNIIGLESE